ncbi:unnamed protein product [Gongylonema pulchrum]|uniref:Four helix bundle protein n=1 Tax=Gongylonema pulchrum TaxID=637853 RepID=A0A183E7A9_9BILA|nr:unnamed protein product [Gongylonema pulchrum]
MKVSAAVVCVTLLDRLKRDQIELLEDTLKQFEMRVYKLVNTFIKMQLKLQ